MAWQCSRPTRQSSPAAATSRSCTNGASRGATAAIREFYRAAYTHVWVLGEIHQAERASDQWARASAGASASAFTGRIAWRGRATNSPCRRSASASCPTSAAPISFRGCSDWTGLYFALTGRSIGPADAYRLRLVTHYIPSAHFHVIKDALSDNHPIDRLLDGLHRDPGEGELARFTPIIDRAFSAPSVEEILERLDAERGEDAEWARETAAEIRKKSPTSLKIAFAQMRRGKGLDARTRRLKLEFRLASHLVATHDYREGIEARIAGKGRAPQLAAGDASRTSTMRAIESLFATPVRGRARA